MNIDIIIGFILILLTFFLLTVLIFRIVRNYIRHQEIVKAQKLVEEDLKNNFEHKHNVILNNNVSAAINSARNSMKGIKK